METRSITSRQYFLIVVFSTTSTAFFLVPPVLIANAGPHAWIVPIWTGFVGITGTLFWMYLATKFPKLNLIEICIRIFGRYAGRLCGLLLAFEMFMTCCWLIYNLQDFVTNTQLNKTNAWVIDATFLLLVLYSTVKGITSIARTTEVVMPIVAVTFLLFFLLVLNTWDWGEFTPALEVNGDGLFRKSSLMIAFPFMDAFSLIMIFPLVQKKPAKTYLKGAVFAALFLSFITFIITGSLGISRASHLTYPLFTMAQELEVSEFLEHMESTISLLWLMFIYVKLAFTFYATVMALSCIFNIGSRGLIALPLAVLLLGFSQSMHQNTIFDIEWVTRYLLIHHTFYTVIIPLVLIGAYLAFRRRRFE